MRCLLRNIISVLFLMLAASFAHAQTPPVCTPGPHCVELNWVASTSAATSTGLGYQVYRLNNVCPTPAPATIAAATTDGFQLISGAVPLTVLTYTDNGFPLAPIPPGAYCYFVVSTVQGATSVPSNTALGLLLPAAPGNLSIILVKQVVIPKDPQA